MLPDEDEKIAMCKAVTNAGADYIRRLPDLERASTMEDVKLFKKYIGPGVKIKAAGGFAPSMTFRHLLTPDAPRGTSSAVKLVMRVCKILSGRIFSVL